MIEIHHNDDSGEVEVWLGEFLIIGLGQTEVDALTDAISEVQEHTETLVKMRDALKEQALR